MRIRHVIRIIDDRAVPRLMLWLVEYGGPLDDFDGLGDNYPRH
jgi:hypothetical protein